MRTITSQYAVKSHDPAAMRAWLLALELTCRGLPPIEVIRATGVKRSTYFYRIAKERRLREHSEFPRQT